jgi:DNA repair protein RecN (Recombination protein N)
MSGQFEQRRLARPAFQLDVLDAYAGDEQLRRRAELARAWRTFTAARRRRDELADAAAGREAHLAELRELVARAEGLRPGDDERLREERERLRHVTELAVAAAGAAETLAPESGEGAAELADHAAGALGPVAHLAPELAAVEGELGEAQVRLREAASSLRAFLASLEAEPGRLEAVEADLDRIAEVKRRFGVASYAELMARVEEAERELAAAEAGADPAAEAGRALAEAQAAVDGLAADLRAARRAAAEPFAAAVRGALGRLAMGGGDFRADLSEREPGPTGADTVSFLIRPNEGMPFAPVADTASGGELSRVALALRTVAHAGAAEPTVVFDEIDAGIGGETAHAVAEALRDLGTRAQVVTITHLPQIASVADAHFRVEKVPGDPTHTRIAALGDAERREELERMLGGAEFIASLR